MKKYIIAFSLLIVTSICFSQTPASIGTYQIMTTNVKAREVFSSEILLTIENNRKLDKVVVLKIGNYSWVRILSKTEINAINFTPLLDQIILIDENDEVLNESISIRKTHN